MKKIVGYLFIKRLFDIVSSLLLAIILSWFLLIIMIINIFATHGAPFYGDQRVGQNGKSLKLLKFRSMYKDAESHPEKYLSPEQLQIWKKERKVDNDPRITKFGRFLRKSSIDELPQLFNIIAGQMSVVGPRPLNKKELELNYSGEDGKLLISVKPGLISNWGVNGRNNVTYETGERQRLELEYFKKRSLLYDLKLIFKATVVVIFCKGAQ